MAERAYKKLIWHDKGIRLMPEFMQPLMFDFCRNSGGALIVLDRLIDTTPEGKIDTADLKVLWKMATLKPDVERRRWYNSVVKARLEYVMALIVKDNSQGDFALGWSRRVVSFFDFGYGEEHDSNTGVSRHSVAYGASAVPSDPSSRT